MEDFRTLFEIPAENMPKFEAQIAKLSKKSLKLIGSEIKPFTFSHEEKTLSDGHKHRVYSVMLTAEMPRLNGWTFLARLDHSNDAGTVIRMVPNAGELPTQYRTATSTTCDHCGHKRYRRDTFVVRNDETGETKQVGSTCLKDFFGHDPYKIAKLAELLGYAYECGRGGEQFVSGLADLRWVDVEEFCMSAARAVLRHGWVSGKAAYEDDRLVATRERAWGIYGSDFVTQPFTTDERNLAAAALEWAASLASKCDRSDYEHNISVVAGASMIEPRSCGLAASIVGVYFNNQQKVANASVAKTVDVGNFEGVISLFKTGSSAIKWPKIRLSVEGKPIVLSISGPNSKAPGSINVTDGGPFGDNIWYGRVSPQGVWDRSRSVNGQTMTSLTALLSALSQDPAGTASKHGKLTGQCCFCSKPLNDARSTAVGYGKTCAAKWGLAWGAK